MTNDLPLTVENADGKTVAALSEDLLEVGLYIIDRLRRGGTLKRDGEFLYACGEMTKRRA